MGSTTEPCHPACLQCAGTGGPDAHGPDTRVWRLYGHLGRARAQPSAGSQRDLLPCGGDQRETRDEEDGAAEMILLIG